MVKFTNQSLVNLSYAEFCNGEEIIISNCTIDTLDLNYCVIYEKITIKNSTIKKLLLHSCWFIGGLIFKNNKVISRIEYPMGGHNKEPIEFISNTFYGFFDFFDCHFEASVTFKDNILLGGSNLCANKDKGYVNTFKTPIICSGNSGRTDIEY